MLERGEKLVTELIALLPDLLVAALLLLAGWFLAGFLRLTAGRVLRLFNDLMAGRFQVGRFESLYVSSSIQALVGQLVYWTTLLLFVSLAIRVLNPAGGAVWLDRLVAYLPSLLAGSVIIIGGVVAAGFIRKLVSHTANAANVSRPELLGQSAQISFVIVAFILGLDQIGIDVTFLAMVFGIVLAGLLAGFALAFAFGARALVENLIANQHLRQVIKPGQSIACGPVRGRVLEFTATGVWLDSGTGRTLMPAKYFLSESLSVLTSEAGDGES